MSKEEFSAELDSLEEYVLKLDRTFKTIIWASVIGLLIVCCIIMILPS
jgi:hypothetical protein